MQSALFNGGYARRVCECDDQSPTTRTCNNSSVILLFAEPQSARGRHQLSWYLEAQSAPALDTMGKGSQEEKHDGEEVTEENKNLLPVEAATVTSGRRSEDEDGPPPPPDGGWGWVVVAASFLCNMVSKYFLQQ